MQKYLQNIFKGVLIILIVVINNLGLFGILTCQADRFDDDLNTSTNQGKIGTTANGGSVLYTTQITSIKDFMIFLLKNIGIPIGVLTGVVVAIAAFYKLMFSQSSEETKKSSSFLVWGTIGVIVMMSSIFIATTLVGQEGGGGIIKQNDLNGIQMAQKLYGKIIFPFFKLAAYLVIGILFIVLLLHVYKYVFVPDESIQKNSKTILIWNTLGILCILFAKQLVESVYGDISNTTVNNVGEIGAGFLQNQKFQFVYDIINRFLGIISMIVLIIIIYQCYLLLTKPDDQDTMTKLRKSFIYLFIGIMIIGTGYLLTNFMIIK